MAAVYAEELVTVMNPIVESKMAERLPLSPRLDSLSGKTLYLVDINWGGPQAAWSVYEQMEAWMAVHMPDVKVVRKRLAASYMVDDPAMWAEIAEKGDAAIIGIAG
ncbi:MAG: hypothetical protein A3I78_01485 [Gammaproteobacteria bacterium RIFCSPLOWO2_02_FULL_56_15]|nr:MAG: hypothetical protein A3I78_01485 [Gammaproteobacteria bacterium RIFCSPLOWO2_02_FULL_56_15]